MAQEQQLPLETVNVSQPDYAGKLACQRLKLIGAVTLKVLYAMERYQYAYLDISEAEFVIDKEEWAVCLGWSHSGPVYGNSGYRDVEVLRRFLEEINATTILLPDDVMRRHINSAKKNEHIQQLLVSETCKSFALVEGKLMNKKKTIVIF